MGFAGEVFPEWYWGPIFFFFVFGLPLSAVALAVDFVVRRWVRRAPYAPSPLPAVFSEEMARADSHWGGAGARQPLRRRGRGVRVRMTTTPCGRSRRTTSTSSRGRPEWPHGLRPFARP